MLLSGMGGIVTQDLLAPGSVLNPLDHVALMALLGKPDANFPASHQYHRDLL